jgi:DNA-binding transcriptional LysR family regulator
MSKRNEQWESRIGRRLKLRDLDILSSVVQYGSMAKAATHLDMSQPSVSESIVKLEVALGVRLLDRGPRGVEPTCYAQALLQRSQVVFDELRQGIRDLDFLSDPSAGEVRVACGDTAAAGLMPAVIEHLSRRYPRVVVHVIQANAETPEFRELRERKVDLALARVSASLQEEDLAVEMLFEDPHRVVVGTRSRWSRRRKIALSDLMNEAWMLPSGRVARQLIAEAFAARGLPFPRESVNASSILLRNQLLATGRFVTVLPTSVLRYNARQWSLKALPIDLAVKPRCVAMLMLKRRTPSPVVQLFADHVRAAAKRMSVGAE